jgi:phage shock protein PspC (stress-responsive transcriptional regulator)
VLITASRHPESGAKLYRSRTDRVLAGVLGGFAEKWGVSSTLVRIVFVVLAILTSGVFAVILYVLAAAFIPEQQVAFGDAADTPAPPAPPVPPAPPIPAPVAPATSEPPAASAAPVAPSVPESFSAPVVS